MFCFGIGCAFGLCWLGVVCFYWFGLFYSVRVGVHVLCRCDALVVFRLIVLRRDACALFALHCFWLVWNCLCWCAVLCVFMLRCFVFGVFSLLVMCCDVFVVLVRSLFSSVALVGLCCAVFLFVALVVSVGFRFGLGVGLICGVVFSFFVLGLVCLSYCFAA